MTNTKGLLLLGDESLACTYDTGCLALASNLFSGVCPWLKDWFASLGEVTYEIGVRAQQPC